MYRWEVAILVSINMKKQLKNTKKVIVLVYYYYKPFLLLTIVL